MVYCGKPSGGCHACRERKTRCDQVPEGCTQCKRAKRECPGYRIQGDLIFRDHTTSVIKKAKSREAKAKKALKEPQNPSPDLSLEIVQQKQTPLSVFSLAPTLEERAVGCFVTNYVIGMNGPSRGHMDYLVDIFQVAGSDEWLECSMKAVGLAALAHAVHAPSLVKNARYQYVRAIQATNKALRDPFAVKKDSTLVSVMVLAIFETITGSDAFSFRDWVEHLNGAAAIIKVRGYDQIKTPAGRRMLMQICAGLLPSSIQRGVHLPKHIRAYVEAAFRYVDNPEAAFVVMHTMMRLTSLRADIQQHVLTDRHEILKHTLELDGILVDIVASNPPGWSFEIVNTDEDFPSVFNRQYHVYYDFWMSQVWNALRTMRILIGEMIRNVLLDGFACKPPLFRELEYTAQFQISTDVLYQMQLDIFCSVPQHLGFPFLTNSQALSNSLGALPGQILNVPMQGMAGLLWPLWLAGLVDVATPETKKFAVQNLMEIARLTGINQAKILADLIVSNGVEDLDETVWKGLNDQDQVATLEEGLVKEV